MNQQRHQRSIKEYKNISKIYISCSKCSNLLNNHELSPNTIVNLDDDYTIYPPYEIEDIVLKSSENEGLQIYCSCDVKIGVLNGKNAILLKGFTNKQIIKYEKQKNQKQQKQKKVSSSFNKFQTLEGLITKYVSYSFANLQFTLKKIEKKHKNIQEIQKQLHSFAIFYNKYMTNKKHNQRKLYSTFKQISNQI